jgi:hypothetical protein
MDIINSIMSFNISWQVVAAIWFALVCVMFLQLWRLSNMFNELSDRFELWSADMDEFEKRLKKVEKKTSMFEVD